MRQKGRTVSPQGNQERSAYVVERLTDALLQLLREKDLTQISISELCSRAEVGRASFYRSFQSREDILRRRIQQLFCAAMEEESRREAPLSAHMGAMIAHFRQHINFYAALSERNLIHLLKDAVVGLYGPGPDQTAEEAYAAAFAAYALYGWIEVWFSRGMEDTPEEITALFRKQGL